MPRERRRGGCRSTTAAGTPAAFAAAREVLDAAAGTVFELDGTTGSGSAMKVVNQMLAGAHVAATAGANTFG